MEYFFYKPYILLIEVLLVFSHLRIIKYDKLTQIQIYMELVH